MNALTKHEQTNLAPRGMGFDLSPQNFDQAMAFSNMLAESDLVPKDFKGKPGNCLIAMQWGSELGLKPLQALSNIAVVNGRAALWGDAVIALVRGSSVCEYVQESDDGHTATCRAKRKGEPEHVVTFSMDDATQAGLAGKQGPWTQYPKRMRQMRARAFALRDVFPDVLRGMPIAEEVQDTPTERHMGPAEVVGAPPAAPAPAPAEWPADRWAAGLSKWVDGIASGKPIEEVLTWLRSKAPVSAAQEAELRAEVAKLVAPPADVTDVAPKVNPDALAADMTACHNLDKLYELGGLLDAITDEAQHLRLTEIFNARVAALEAQA